MQGLSQLRRLMIRSQSNAADSRAQELFSIWNINIESCRIWPMLQRSGRIGFNSDVQFFL
jgi:hypothetical protein